MNDINEKRYDDSVKLALALGEIDDALIEEARTPYPIFMTTKRLVTLAATLLVVIVVGIAAIALAPVFAPTKDAGGDETSSDAGSENNGVYGVGDVARLGDSSIVLIDKTNGKYTFLLTLSKDITSLDIYIYGYTQSMENIVATTSAKLPEGYEKVDMPKILVNGKESSTLPKNAGTYTVTIDTEEMKTQYILSRFGITYFGAVFNYN